MSDCVVRRWRSGRKAADATVNLSTDETSGSQQFARKLKMRAEIIVPVETRAWGSGIHDAEPDHGEEDNIPVKRQLTSRIWAALQVVPPRLRVSVVNPLFLIRAHPRLIRGKVRKDGAHGEIVSYSKPIEAVTHTAEGGCATRFWFR